MRRCYPNALFYTVLFGGLIAMAAALPTRAQRLARDVPSAGAGDPVVPGHLRQDLPGLPPVAGLPGPLAERHVDPAALDAWIDAVRATLPDQEDDPYAVIDACVAAEMQALDIPGASIAIAANGVITYTKGYGVKHAENGGEIDTETMFRIGSTSKMMTAASVMKLVETGEMDLHAPITEVAPGLELPAPWDASQITPHHLLTHSSGMPDSYRLHTLERLYDATLDEWVSELLPRTPLQAPPGSFWNYANPNFSLAGHLIEMASGQPHASYVKERLWEPAGMPLTTYDVNAVMEHENFAWGHDGPARITPKDLPMSALAPAGAVFSTPTEMVTWAEMLQAGGGNVLSETSVAAMQEPHVSMGYSPWEQYGYGIFVTDYRDLADESRTVRVYDHGGNTTGWGSQLFWVPERGITFSILDNTLNSLNYSSSCVLRELAGVTRQSRAGLGTEPESWRGFVATYAQMNQALWDFTVRISQDAEEGYLVFERPDLGGAAPLMNLFGTTFMIDADRDGQPDPATASLDYTFLPDRGDPSTTRWIRNRIQVAERVGQFPASLALEGDACAKIDFEAEIDAPLVVRAAGLVDPASSVEAGLPIAQDDPADPASASFKQDLTLRGEAGLFLLAIAPDAADVIDLYLLHDTDGDGAFVYPDELVDVGWEGSGGRRVMMVTGRPPAGDYQIWVHGRAVDGEDRSFTMEKRVVDGRQLVLRGAPDRLSSGEPGSVEVCATDIDGLAQDMTGLVEFDYGSTPRRIRVPVHWSPAPVFDAFLPVLLRDTPLR